MNDVNAASLAANPLAANETIIARGRGFGEGVQLLLNGAPVEVISRSDTGIVAIVPAGFITSGAVEVQVLAGGGRSNMVLMPAAAASPGIFSVDGSGAGPGYIFNADGTLNTSTNQAVEGETISFLLTGVTEQSPVAVFIGSFAVADLVSRKSTNVEGLPGLVQQLTVSLPKLSPYGIKLPSAFPLQVISGGVHSQTTVSVFVK